MASFQTTFQMVKQSMCTESIFSPRATTGRTAGSQGSLEPLLEMFVRREM
jgi:hypothetical protein